MRDIRSAAVEGRGAQPQRIVCRDDFRNLLRFTPISHAADFALRAERRRRKPRFGPATIAGMKPFAISYAA